MGYKLILCWEDDEEDMELVQYPLPLRLGHHALDTILCGNRGRMYHVELYANVAAAD